YLGPNDAEAIAERDVVYSTLVDVNVDRRARPVRLDLGMWSLDLDRLLGACQRVKGRTKDVLARALNLASVLHDLRQFRFALVLIKQEDPAAPRQPQARRKLRRVRFVFFALLLLFRSLH